MLRLTTRGIAREAPTARTYARTFDRFAQFLVRTAGEGATVDLEASTARYLEALATGSIDAPKSERGLARTTLGHLLDALRDDPS